MIFQVSGSVGCTEGERAIDWTLVQVVFEVLQPKKNIIVNVHLKGMALYQVPPQLPKLYLHTS